MPTGLDRIEGGGADRRVDAQEQEEAYQRREHPTDGSSPASPVLQDGAATYTPGLSERRSGVSKFYHPDLLGSTRAITNSSQTTTDTAVFNGFGMVVSRTGTTPRVIG